MKASLIIGNNAYAVLKCDHGTWSMDVLLNGGMSASASLVRTAADYRAKAERLIRDADRLTKAAAILQTKHDKDLDRMMNEANEKS